MKAPEWKQHILLLSKDPGIADQVFPAFGNETQFIFGESADNVLEKLRNFGPKIFIVDTASFGDPNTQENLIVESLETLCKKALVINPQVTIIVFLDSRLKETKGLTQKTGASLTMFRKNVSPSRMVYVIRVLRRRTFRTLLEKDLPLGTKLPVDIFYYMPSSDRYVAILPANSLYDQAKRAKLEKFHVRHLFVVEKELDRFFSSEEINKKYVLSKVLQDVRNKHKKLLIDIFDCTTDNDVNEGKKLTATALEVISGLKQLIVAFETPYEVLSSFAFPRWSAIAHSLNCTINSLLFSKLCGLENSSDDLALAALVHNIGLCEIDQKLLEFPENDLEPVEFEKYKSHVEHGISIIKKKKMDVSETVLEMIQSHHELHDGTGFPDKLRENEILDETYVLSIAASFDYFNTTQPGEKAISPKEAWKLLLATNKTKHGYRFKPELMVKLDKYFQTIGT